MESIVEIKTHNQTSFKDQHLKHHLVTQVIFNPTQRLLLLCRLQNAQPFLVHVIYDSPLRLTSHLKYGDTIRILILLALIQYNESKSENIQILENVEYHKCRFAILNRESSSCKENSLSIYLGQENTRGTVLPTQADRKPPPPWSCMFYSFFYMP